MQSYMNRTNVGKVHWNICGKKFISKIGLKKHLPRHSGERSHHNRFWHQLFCQNGTLWSRSRSSCHEYHLFLQWHFLHPDLWGFFYFCSRWKRFKCKKIIKTKEYLKQHVRICVRGGGGNTPSHNDLTFLYYAFSNVSSTFMFERMLHLVFL